MKSKRSHLVRDLSLVGVILGSLGAFYCLVFLQRDVSSDPAAVVGELLNDLLEGDTKEALAHIHPRHQDKARRDLAKLAKARISGDQIARHVVQAIGRGPVQLEIGTRKRESAKRWQIEVVLRSGGVSRRTWIPVAEHGQRWYVDANLYEVAIRAALAPKPPRTASAPAGVRPPPSPSVATLRPPLPPP
jgi:hypothetical protein